MTLPTKMRTVILTGHGGLDRLEYRDDWPVPRPGPGEVLIRIAACGLNNTDINTRTAWYSEPVTEGITDAGAKAGFAQADAASGSWTGRPLTFPRIQGADVAGRIADVGSGVDRARIGERVIVDPWLHGDGDWWEPSNTGYFGSECDGGFADFTTVRASNAIALDTRFTDAELASFPTVLTTAEHLVWRTHLQPGETVVITGASGGVGTTAIQLCRLRGARVIAVAAAAKGIALEALGADVVVDRVTPDLEAAIRAAAGGPVDVVLDVVGGTMFEALVGALRPRGRYSSSGAIAGPITRFDLRTLIYKDLTMTGATITPPGMLRRAVRLIERGALRPILAATFPLRDLARAQEAFISKRHIGNIVVTMD
ncbi:MAG: zinc-binding dehydrogenase [Rhizobiales bacterium]|nr:zinc-binding dehydrogenase [Hyphomicrobiales bacterium]